MPTNAERTTYVDSSAIVKLVVREHESGDLRKYLRRRRSLVSSALARAEVARALLPFGAEAQRRGLDVISRLELVRVNDRVLTHAGSVKPAELRTLDAIHLATALMLGPHLTCVVTYDSRMLAAARALNIPVASPGRSRSSA